MTEQIDLGQHLKDRGHKLTNPRREVWEALTRANSHLTAEQVAQMAGPGVNLASVYRSLTLFAEIGLARESKLGSDGAARWEVAHPDDQFHLVCESCGNVEHHGGELVNQVRSHLNADHGFQASSVDLAVSGVCGTCAA